MLGAAGGHVYQMAANGNHARGNSGLLLAGDVAMPLAGLVFLWMARPGGPRGDGAV